MSPTFLEITMVLLLVGVGWRLGIELLPTAQRFWRQNQQRLDQVEQSLRQPLPLSPKAPNGEAGTAPASAGVGQDERDAKQLNEKEANDE